MRHRLNMRCLVLIPLGQTMLHLPQSIQPDNIFLISSCPPVDICSGALCPCFMGPGRDFCRGNSWKGIRWRRWMTLRTLMPLQGPAVQVALHEPQDMQVRTPGSSFSSLLYKVQSISSSLTAELLDNPNPKSIIGIQIVKYVKCSSTGFCDSLGNRLCACARPGKEYSGPAGFINSVDIVLAAHEAV